MAATASATRSPLRCAEILRALSLSDAAAVIVALDPRFARIALCALHDLAREGFPPSFEAREHAASLQVHVGSFDATLRDACGRRFAVGPIAHAALDRVIAARVAARWP